MRHKCERDERGLSESVQYALILPLLMFVTLGIIQAGVWIHGHNVAVRAANAAADVARGTQGNSAQALATATQLAEAGGLHDVQVTQGRGPASVTVTVAASSPLIFDVGLGRISETAQVPVERVTSP